MKSLLARLIQNWEYLLSVAAMFSASACAAFAAACGAYGPAGIAIFCMLGFAFLAVTFADAADFRRLMAEAARRHADAQRGEGA
ncbi:hypothetical protein [Variovorax boronicumulans]|uniref:hypothetical protein n=1 Tax=Variovorax boronicumulans TaxID=436515 RepID=UPI001C595A47